jgi:hypothetical protein
MSTLRGDYTISDHRIFLAGVHLLRLFLPLRSCQVGVDGSLPSLQVSLHYKSTDVRSRQSQYKWMRRRLHKKCLVLAAAYEQFAEDL